MKIFIRVSGTLPEWLHTADVHSPRVAQLPSVELLQRPEEG